MEASPGDEFEHSPQERDGPEIKEEEQLAPTLQVGNTSLKPDGIQCWDDLWDRREGLGKFSTNFLSFFFLGGGVPV